MILFCLVLGVVLVSLSISFRRFMWGQGQGVLGDGWRVLWAVVFFLACFALGIALTVVQISPKVSFFPSTQTPVHR